MPQTTKMPAGTMDRARPQLPPTIDSWQPVRLLADGRWTYVYQARPVGCSDALPSDYVIKVLKPEFDSDPVAINQIQAEAHIGRSVAHPHLVSILSGSVECSPFYVLMPYLEGITLAWRS